MPIVDLQNDPRFKEYYEPLSPEQEAKDKLEQVRVAEKFRRWAKLKAYILHRDGKILGGTERYTQFLETISNKELTAYDIEREVLLLESEHEFSTC